MVTESADVEQLKDLAKLTNMMGDPDLELRINHRILEVMLHSHKEGPALWEAKMALAVTMINCVQYGVENNASTQQ